jgi:hypothetical protein
MYPEADDPNTVTTPAPNRGVAPAAPVQNRQPGFVVSLCSIAAGLVGFGVPVIGMIASFAGIGLGVWGFRQGRAAHYTPSVTCGLIGITVSVLGIVFWVCAILFESYR